MIPRPFRHAVLLLAILSGCSTYQNVTGYFNTYYNAKKAFGEAVDAAEASRKRTRDTLYYTAYKVDAAAQAKFEKVIEKCSKLIQFYDQSSWVDDAILMIGRSYVYQDENDAAIRKFQEFFENFPTSGLLNEARLWNAKALYFSGRDDEALRAVKELFPEARAEGQSDIMLEALILEAQIYVERNDFAQASVTYALATEVEGDENLRATAQYQAALAFEKVDKLQEAADAFAGVRRFSPSFDIEFKARVGEARNLARLGKYGLALRGLETLFEEPLKVEERAIVDLEIANTDWLMGDSLAAFDLYNHIDTTYRRSDAAAKAQFRRGQIFEREERDYKVAREFYDKAKVEFAMSAATQPAQLRAQTLASYFSHYRDIRKFDSLMVKRLELDSAKRVSDSLALHQPGYLAEVYADSVNAATPALAGAAAAAVPPQEKADTARTAVRTAAAEEDDEDRDRPLGRRRQGGGGSPAAAQRAVTRLPRDVIAAMEDSVSVVKAGKDSGAAAAPAKPAAPAVLYSADSLRSLTAKAYFELGGIFMLELERPDSARHWFGALLERFPGSPYASRTLYALAEIRRSENDSAGVDSLYDVILAHYGESEYADQIRRVRGLEARTAATDTAAGEFARAFQLIDSGRGPDAVAALSDLLRRHPSAADAPRATYTVGWIYENMILDLDSAAAWYERLVAAYPTTDYAAAVKPKLAVKKDPESLSKFVTVREIQAVPKPIDPARRLREASMPKTGDEDEDLQPGRGRTGLQQGDENAADDEEEPEEEDDEESDDEL